MKEKLKQRLNLLEELAQLERLVELKKEQLVFFGRHGIVSLTPDFDHLKEFFPEEMTVDEAEKICRSYGIDDAIIINRILHNKCEPLEA